MKPAVSYDERSSIFDVGGDQAVAQAQFFAQFDAPGFVGDERIGAPLERETRAFGRPDRPADAIVRFEDDEVDRLARGRRHSMRAVRRGQPRQTGADHDHAHRIRPPFGHNRISNVLIPFAIQPVRPFHRDDDAVFKPKRRVDVPNQQELE